MNDNAQEMRKVYDLAQSFGFQFTTAVAQNSEIYFSTQKNEQVQDGVLADALGYVIKRELLSYHPKRWMRAYFESGTLLFNEEKRRLLKCRAGIDFFYLAPEGLVYPCLTIPSPMGDLKGHTVRGDLGERSRRQSEARNRRVREVLDDLHGEVGPETAYAHGSRLDRKGEDQASPGQLACAAVREDLWNARSSSQQVLLREGRHREVFLFGVACVGEKGSRGQPLLDAPPRQSRLTLRSVLRVGKALRQGGRATR